jgi:hypothetical protein
MKIRVSVYFQSFSCIVLLCFPAADDLLHSSFRASMLTLYAIGFAFFMAHHTGSYSLQSVLVAHCFVDILLLSAFSLVCFRPILRKKRHYVAMIGAIPFALWTFIQAATRKTECFDSLQFKQTNIDSHTFKLYKGFWVLSGVVYTLSLPVLTLMFFPKAFSNLQPGVTWIAVMAWFLASVSTVVVSEVTMATVFYAGSNNHLASLQATEWSFGQVMAVVMLFFVVWDMALYPFQSSDEGMGIRLLHWWNTTFTPRYPRVAKFLGFGKVCYGRYLILFRSYW